MKVTVLILTKNPGDILKDVLASVRQQETAWDFEILVIDSGSSDGTCDYVRAFDDVILHEISSSEFGHGKTRNLGVSLAKGEYVALLTHDARPAHSRWLQNMVDALDEDESVAGAFGRHLPYENASPFVRRDLKLHFDGFLQWPKVFRLEDPERYQHDQGYRQVLHFFSDNNAILRKSVWERIPYPDVNFAEDQIWAKKIIEAGFGKAYVDDGAVYHSHNYGVREMLQRSYDESLALGELFGYRLCDGVGPMVAQSVACTVADIKYLFSRDKKSLYPWLFLAPLLNSARQIGFYLGARHVGRGREKSSRLSLDKRLEES